VDAAIEAIKQRAYDFLCRPLDYGRLVRTLDEIVAQLEKNASLCRGHRRELAPIAA
jgi:DNA-binding NtrC family response regulator